MNNSLRIPVSRLLLSLLGIVIITQPLLATHDIWYFVWHEEDYVQGMWKRADMLGRRSTAFLHPVMYVDMLGTEPADLVEKIMGRLKAHRPEKYSFQYTAKVEGKTVVVNIDQSPADFRSLRNEIVLSFLMQSGFDNVTFILPDGKKSYGLNDIDLPWFDLRKPGAEFVPIEKSEDEARAEETGDSIPQVEEEKEDALPDSGTTTVGISQSTEQENPDDREPKGIPLWGTILLAFFLGGIGFWLGRQGKKG